MTALRTISSRPKLSCSKRLTVHFAGCNCKNCNRVAVSLLFVPTVYRGDDYKIRLVDEPQSIREQLLADAWDVRYTG